MYHTKEDVKLNPFPRSLRIHSYALVYSNSHVLGSHLPNYSCGITKGKKKKKTEGRKGGMEGGRKLLL